MPVTVLVALLLRSWWSRDHRGVEATLAEGELRVAGALRLDLSACTSQRNADGVTLRVGARSWRLWLPEDEDAPAESSRRLQEQILAEQFRRRARVPLAEGTTSFLGLVGVAVAAFLGLAGMTAASLFILSGHYLLQ